MKNKKKDFDNFDVHAKNYREIHNKNLKLTGENSDYFSMYKIKEVKSHENKVPKKILDLGCGDGKTVEFFRKYFVKSKIYGIDVSNESIGISRNKNLKNCFFKTYNGKEIPYEKDSFNLLFISCVMHHVNKKNHRNLIKETKRVLEKGSKIYIFEHNPLNPITLKIVNDCEFDKDAVLMNSWYLKKLLKKCGYRNVKIRYTLFFPRKSFFNKILFLEKYLSWIPFGGQYYVVGEK